MMRPTLSLNDPPELDGKGDAVEEGGGEADDDGCGEQGAAAAGVQESHPQNCLLPKFTKSFSKLLLSLDPQSLVSGELGHS